MKRIPLTQDQFAIVDDKYYVWFSQWKWCSKWNKDTQSFYAVRTEWTCRKQYTIYMHREILGLEKGDKRQADHINHKTLDNRESNLRIVSRNKNQWNRKSPKGYCWNKLKKKYQAQIRVNGKKICLGNFEIPEEAHQAYLKAKKKYHEI